MLTCVPVETTLHLCRDCPFTRQVLQSHVAISQVCLNPAVLQLELLDWLSICVNELSSLLLGELVYLLWGIWKERNNRVWNDKNGTVMDIIISSMARLRDFRSVKLKSSPNVVRQSSPIKWKVSAAGIFKVNVDGSFLHSINVGSIGFVKRDSLGSFLAGGGKAFSGILSAEHVEILACKQAIEFVLANNLTPAVIETDAQLVYLQLINKQDGNFSVLGRLYEDVGLLLRGYRPIQMAHAKRSANTAAHLMAAHSTPLTTDLLFYCTSLPSDCSCS
ncbi:hypothetical protein ACLB2K_028601 [Fragaria x ananassa]